MQITLLALDIDWFGLFGFLSAPYTRDVRHQARIYEKLRQPDLQRSEAFEPAKQWKEACALPFFFSRFVGVAPNAPLAPGLTNDGGGRRSML